MRVGRLVLAAVAVPVATKVLRKAGRSIQARKGGSPMGKAMQKTASGLEAVRRSGARAR